MAETKFAGIKACVFDAYGTLFDVHSAVGRHRARLGDKADAVSDTWRNKQLQYTWLRSLMGRYIPFWQVTQDALDFAMQAHGVEDAALRRDLCDAYLSLDCYPEVPGVLGSLHRAGLQTAVLSNGSPDMLDAAVRSAGLDELLDASLSVDSIGCYKPDMRVYQMACDHFGLEPVEISFQSANAWDAYAAASFGFQVAWCNRFGQTHERLPDSPGAEIKTLAELPRIVTLG